MGCAESRDKTKPENVGKKKQAKAHAPVVRDKKKVAPGNGHPAASKPASPPKRCSSLKRPAPGNEQETKDSTTKEKTVKQTVYQVQLVGDRSFYTSGDKGVQQLIAGTEIVMVASSSQHALFVDASNTVYTMGTGNHGQLGSSRTELEEPTVIPFFQQNNCVPRVIGCGEQHSIVACTDAVYTFGRGLSGQLGNGETSDVLTPTKIPFFELPNEVQDLSCGTHHVLVIYGGRVYTYGWNAAGQLMLGDTKNRLTPTRVTFFDDKHVVGTACGAQHSVVLCKDHMYVGGSNRNGQLGIGRDVKTVSVPLELPFFNGKAVRSLSAWYHSVVCCSDGVYTFGEGEHGALGHGAKDDVFEPRLVEGLKGKDAQHVAACFSHTAVVCSDGVYIWGAKNIEPPESSPAPLFSRVPIPGQARCVCLSFFSSLVVAE